MSAGFWVEWKYNKGELAQREEQTTICGFDRAINCGWLQNKKSKVSEPFTTRRQKWGEYDLRT